MKNVSNWIWIGLGLVMAVAVVWVFNDIITYLLIAGVISLVSNPLVELFQKIRIGKYQMPRTGSAILTLIALSLIVVGLLSLFIPLVMDEYRIISSINASEIYQSLEGPMMQAQLWMDQYEFSKTSGQSSSEYLQEQLLAFIKVTDITNIFQNLFGTVGNMLMGTFIVTFILFFFLKEEDMFYRLLMSIVPVKLENHFANIWTHSRDLLRRYFVGIVMQLSIIATLVSLGMWALGVDNALLIGFFAGLINIIPYVGPLIGALFGILIGVSVNLHLPFYPDMTLLIGKMALVFGTVQILDNFVFQPFIFSNSVRAHPLEIFIVILAAASMGGIAGMILAIPVYTIVRVVAREFFSEWKVVKNLTEEM